MTKVLTLLSALSQCASYRIGLFLYAIDGNKLGNDLKVEATMKYHRLNLLEDRSRPITHMSYIYKLTIGTGGLAGTVAACQVQGHAINP